MAMAQRRSTRRPNGAGAHFERESGKLRCWIYPIFGYAAGLSYIQKHRYSFFLSTFGFLFGDCRLLAGPGRHQAQDMPDHLHLHLLTFVMRAAGNTLQSLNLVSSLTILFRQGNGTPGSRRNEQEEESGGRKERLKRLLQT